MEELLEIPELRPTTVDDRAVSPFTLSGAEDGTIEVGVPDDLDATKVAEVIEAHKPAAAQDPADPRADLEAEIDAATSINDLKAIIKKTLLNR